MNFKRWNIYSFDTTLGPETKTLITTGIDKSIVLLSLLISNYSQTDNANITVNITDGTNNLFKFNITIPSGNSPMAIDSKIVLNSGDVMQVTSDIDDVAVLASGDES